MAKIRIAAFHPYNLTVLRSHKYLISIIIAILYRHPGEGRAQSEAFQRYPDGFRSWFFRYAGSSPA
jgi:hypothetical protein